jgi:membrane protease YdiL (CAAX protease family)
MKRHIIELTLLYLSFYLPGLLVQSPAASNPSAVHALAGHLTPYMLQYLLVGLPQALLVLYIIWVQREVPLSSFGIISLKLPDIASALLLYVGLFGLFFILAVSITILPAGAKEIFRSGYRWRLSGSSQLPLALLFCLTTGYREELFFRSYLLTRFTDLGLKYGVAAAASTALFAIGHLYQGWGGMIYAVMHGFLFSFAFYRRRNLHILALSHGFYNFTILLISTKLPV